MRRALFSFLGLMIGPFFAVAGSAQTLYGISFSGTDGLSTLHTVSTLTGAATPVGPVGFERCSGMDFDAGGTLFAACERSDGSDVSVLITIDPATGAGTEVGPTGTSGATSDISFRPADGVLFAYDASNDPDHSLFTLDTATGAGTLVGDTGLSFAGGNAMTFVASGLLYHSQFAGGPFANLNSLAPATGLPTFLGQISPVTERFAAFDVHPVTELIYGVLNTGASGGGPTALATVDPVALTATTIGPTQNGLDAIAFGPVPIVITGSKGVAGTFEEGGAITYTIVLTNSSAAGQLDNPGDEFTDTLPGGLTLTSASATSGTASTVGNTVTWNGAIPGNGSVTITIDATIDSGSAGLTLSNQGTFNFDADGNGSNESSGTTDDPGLPGGTDPTDLVVGSGVNVLEIPTLGEYGLMFLALMLAGLGFGVIRRRG